MYYPIDESLAKRAHEAMSFREYQTGSTTADYKIAVDEATGIAERQKSLVSEFYHEKIDNLLDSFSRRLADWYNANNRNRASCPSIMVAGGSNFPVHKKEKQNARGRTLMAEYDDIVGILDKIKSVGTGPVDLADPHAKEILEDKLKKLKETQEMEKAINAWYRKKKTCIGCPGIKPDLAEKVQKSFEAVRSRSLYDIPFPAYELTSIREKIKRTQKRLDELVARQGMNQADLEEAFDGGKIVRNIALDRLQIIFDEKPDESQRNMLKASGFRWAPSQGAWQRKLTENAMHYAKNALGL